MIKQLEQFRGWMIFFYLVLLIPALLTFLFSIRIFFKTIVPMFSLSVAMGVMFLIENWHLFLPLLALNVFVIFQAVIFPMRKMWVPTVMAVQTLILSVMHWILVFWVLRTGIERFSWHQWVMFYGGIALPICFVVYLCFSRRVKAYYGRNAFKKKKLFSPPINAPKS